MHARKQYGINGCTLVWNSLAMRALRVQSRVIHQTPGTHSSLFYNKIVYYSYIIYLTKIDLHILLVKSERCN